jgi:hypothetical protein
MFLITEFQITKFQIIKFLITKVLIDNIPFLKTKLLEHRVDRVLQYKLSLPSSELGLPTPHPQASVPALVPWAGKNHSHLRGVPIRTKGTDHMYFVGQVF